MRPKLMRPMDLLVALAAGAVVTVCVSWALALHADPDLGGSVERAPWPGPVDAGWPPTSRYTTSYGSAWSGLRQWKSWGNLDGSHTGQFHMFVSRAGWPFPALESRLKKRVIGGYWSAHDGPYDNDGMLAAGLAVPLHWSRPHAAGEEGWCSRRLPLLPVAPGLVANTFGASVLALGLTWLWRLQPPAGGRRMWRRAAAVLVCGVVLNLIVAVGLWVRWQCLTPARPFESNVWRGGASADQCATGLRGERAKWPVPVPESWPSSPHWIGWLGDAWGVRACEFTSNGIPAAAYMWFHVTWGSEAFDPHQKMNVVQAGWPLPCLQSEELIEVEGRSVPAAPPDVASEFELRSLFKKTSPLTRRGVLLDVTLPGAPAPTWHSDPMPLLPVRPVWPGLVVNSVVFSALAAVVLWTPGAIRTLRRRTAGLCRSCGYDARELAVCPECGATRPTTASSARNGRR